MENKSDRDFVEFLSEIDSETIETPLRMLDNFWQIEVDNLKSQISNGIPEAHTPERIKLSEKLVYIIRYFGSHGVAYIRRLIFSDETGVHYTEICWDVFKGFNKQLKKRVDLPRVASVSDY